MHGVEGPFFMVHPPLLGNGAVASTGLFESLFERCLSPDMTRRFAAPEEEHTGACSDELFSTKANAQTKPNGDLDKPKQL